MKLNKKTSNILNILSDLYPNPKSELNFNNSYQLLIAVTLSAQCTDKKVNQVTHNLFLKYLSFQDLAKAKLKEVESIIREVNYYKTKSRNIIELSKIVIDRYNGEIPLVHEELIKLPGVGNKTANVVLGELGIVETFPVDTHVFRVSQRLGFVKGKNVLEVEKQLKSIFPKNLWRSLHHYLILHGRRFCKAQNPNCNQCKVSTYCPSFNQLTVKNPKKL